MKLETNTRLLHHNMAIMGGCLAGYTLLNRIHFLGTAQTNNMIHLVFDLCGRNFFEVLLRLGGFLCYILGTVTFVLITQKTAWNVKYISLGVNLIAYLIMGLLPEDMQDILVLYPAFFAVSLQWNSFPGAYGYVSSTIFSTNNIKQATLSMTEYLVEKKKDSTKRFRSLFFITSFLCFEFGVFCSYFASELLGARSILLDGFFAIPALLLLNNDRKIAK